MLSLLVATASAQVVVVPETPPPPPSRAVVVPESVPVVPAPVPVPAGTVPVPAGSVVQVAPAVPGGVTVRAFDPAVARRQLAIEPRVIVAPAPTPTPVPPPGTTTQTTRTTTVVDAPGLPPRVYNRESNTVIVHEQNQARELPYVTVPVLFVKGTAELLDAQSAAAIQQIASVITEVSQTNPNALFDVEGHTSTDGTAEMNMELSAARAQRVHAELTQRYGVPGHLLTAHGYGENFPAYPDASEEQMQLDRRVLVVRTR